MRTIKELIEKEERVWLYLDSEKTARDFLRRAAAEGFHRSDGVSLSQMPWGYVMAIHSNLTVAHLPMFAWVMSCSGQVRGMPTRIDYARYMAGEPDYLCRESHFRGGLQFHSISP